MGMSACTYHHETHARAFHPIGNVVWHAILTELPLRYLPMSRGHVGPMECQAWRSGIPPHKPPRQAWPRCALHWTRQSKPKQASEVDCTRVSRTRVYLTHTTTPCTPYSPPQPNADVWQETPKIGSYTSKRIRHYVEVQSRPVPPNEAIDSAGLFHIEYHCPRSSPSPDTPYGPGDNLELAAALAFSSRGQSITPYFATESGRLKT